MKTHYRSFFLGVMTTLLILCSYAYINPPGSSDVVTCKEVIKETIHKCEGRGGKSDNYKIAMLNMAYGVVNDEYPNAKGSFDATSTAYLNKHNPIVSFVNQPRLGGVYGGGHNRVLDNLYNSLQESVFSETELEELITYKKYTLDPASVSFAPEFQTPLFQHALLWDKVAGTGLQNGSAIDLTASEKKLLYDQFYSDNKKVELLFKTTEFSTDNKEFNYDELEVKKFKVPAYSKE